MARVSYPAPRYGGCVQSFNFYYAPTCGKRARSDLFNIDYYRRRPLCASRARSSVPHGPPFRVRYKPTGMSKVYFLEGADRIKIGTTCNLNERIRDIQAMSPIALTLLGAWEGGHSLEAHIHRLFADDRTHGEWFTSTPGLLEYIRVGNERPRYEATRWVQLTPKQQCALTALATSADPRTAADTRSAYSTLKSLQIRGLAVRSKNAGRAWRWQATPDGRLAYESRDTDTFRQGNVIRKVMREFA